MSAEFDPYYKWLGIPPQDQPPHHYRLLGLELFEGDLQVIEAAADRQLSFLRKMQSGEHGFACRQLINEVSRARVCLLRPGSKQAYDAQLQAELERPASEFSATDVATSTKSPFQADWRILTAVGMVSLLVLASVSFFLSGRRAANPKVVSVENKAPVASNVRPEQPGKLTTENPLRPVESVERKSTSEIDLLPLLDAKQIVHGAWLTQPQKLESLSEISHATIKLPVTPPEEYSLRFEGMRLAHTGDGQTLLGVGIVCGGHDCLVALQVRKQQGGSGLQQVDQSNWSDNETTLPETSIPIHQPFVLEISVRKSELEARLNGRTFILWNQDFSRLSLSQDFKLPDPHQLFLVAESKYSFRKIVMGPPLLRRPPLGSDLRPGSPVDLLKLVDLNRDVWRGTWAKEGSFLKNFPNEHYARVSLPFQTPEEYELVADIESERPGEFYLGLPFQRGFAGMRLGQEEGRRSSLIGESASQDQRDVQHQGTIFPSSRNRLTATVRKNHLVVKVGEVVVFDWKGDARRFKPHPSWATPGRQITIGTAEIPYRIHTLTLTRLPTSPDVFSLPAPPQSGNLLPVVNVDRDSAVGRWQSRDGKLESVDSGSTGVRIPAKLPLNYEFRCIVQLIKNPVGSLLVTVPVADKPVTLHLGFHGGNPTSGIESFEGKRFFENSTTQRHGGPLLPEGKSRVLHGTVQGSHLRVDLDGEKLWDLEIPDSLTNSAGETYPVWFNDEERRQIYIATWNTGVGIHDLRFRSLDSQSAPFPAFEVVRKIESVPGNAAVPRTADALTKSAVGIDNEIPEGLFATGTLTVPDSATLKEASRKMREGLADDYSLAKKDADKIGLAKKLLKLAAEPHADSVTKYAGFIEALHLFTEIGDPIKANSVIESMASQFQMDAIELRLTTFKALVKKLKGPLQNKSFALLSLTLTDQLIRAERYSQALDLAVLASQVTSKTKDKDLQAEIQEALQTAQILADEFPTVESARETLRSKPDDPTARLVWGAWLCERKDNWAEGLPLLASCSDDVLKGLAVRDLAGPGKNERLKLGTEWLNYAKSGKNGNRTVYVERAIYWLSQAYPQARGLEKSLTEVALEEACQLRAGAVALSSLLKLLETKSTDANHVRTEESPTNGGKPFDDICFSPGILIGLNCSVGSVSGRPAITGVQPLYFTTRGPTEGKWTGAKTGRQLEIRAKAGYAVSGLRCQVDGSLVTLQVLFSRITKSGLNHNRNYRSAAVNVANQDQLKEFVIPAGPQPYVGIFGRFNGQIRSLGLIQMR